MSTRRFLPTSTMTRQKKRKRPKRVQNRPKREPKQIKELKIIALQSKDVGQFKELAKQYGVLFAVIKDKAQNEKVDVMFKAEDVAKLNRIYEQLGYAIPKVTTADRKKDPTRRQSGDSLLTRGKNPLDIDPRPSVRATIMALKSAARTAAQAQEKVQDIIAEEER